MRTKYQPHFIHLRNHAQFLQEIAKQPIMQKNRGMQMNSLQISTFYRYWQIALRAW